MTSKGVATKERGWDVRGEEEQARKKKRKERNKTCTGPRTLEKPSHEESVIQERGIILGQAQGISRTE